MRADAVERVAEHQGPPDARVEEWLHAQVVARTEQALPPAVPQREGEVAEELPHTILAPHIVGMQDELCVRHLPRNGPARLLDTCRELNARIDARVRSDPNASIETCRLALGGRLEGRSEHRVPQSCATFRPNVAGVRPAKREGLGHRVQRGRVDGSPVEVDDSTNAAHRKVRSEIGMAPSKAA